MSNPRKREHIDDLQPLTDLAAAGYTPIEIARELGCSAKAVAEWLAQAALPHASNAGDALTPGEREELNLLRREVQRLQTERDFVESEAKRREAAVREDERKLALAIEGSGTGVWDRNAVTGEIYYSPGWKAILGYEEWELGNTIEESYTRLHPDDLAYVKEKIQGHFDRKTENYSVEHRIRCKDGSYKWISSRGRVVSRDADGKPLRMVGTTTDITNLRTLATDLQNNVDLITNLTNAVSGLLFQYRLSREGLASFSYVSQGVDDIYELTPQQLAADASLVYAVIHPDDLPRYRTSFEESALSLKPWHLEYRVVLPRQGLCWRQGDARPQRLQDGSIVWHGLITDVTERKHVETELQEFASIDFLTQLPNRRHFIGRMQEELTRIQCLQTSQTAVLMCDLDHFKRVNDSFGHAVGDLVLKHFAGILGEVLRKSDIVGRVGGEEFAVVLPGASGTDAHSFAQRLQKRIAQFPMIHEGRSIEVTVSIGIAAMSTADNTADAPLSRADTALYHAKANGRNRIECL